MKNFYRKFDLIIIILFHNIHPNHSVLNRFTLTFTWIAAQSFPLPNLKNNYHRIVKSAYFFSLVFFFIDFPAGFVRRRA